MEQDLCRGVVYFTVLCDHPYLVSLLFAVLVSLHPVTFSNVFYYLHNYDNAVLFRYLKIIWFLHNRISEPTRFLEIVKMCE